MRNKRCMQDNSQHLGRPRSTLRLAAGLFLILMTLVNCSPSRDEYVPPDVKSLPGFEAVRRRCQDIDAKLPQARVVYENNAQLVRGEQHALTLAVTLDTKMPPDKLLMRSGAKSVEGYLLSCRLQARLHVASGQFDLDDHKWVDRSLLTTNTAEWAWFVRPKLGGTHTVVYELRPVLQASEQRAPLDPVWTAPSESSISQFEAAVHVEVPWSQRLPETISWISEQTGLAEGLVAAFGGLFVALIAAIGAWQRLWKPWRKRKRKRKRRAQSPPSSTTGP